MSEIVRAYREHYRAIRSVIARYVKRAEDVEDLAQEAFLRGYMTELSERIARPRAYLIRIARNLAIDELRRRRGRPLYLEDFDSKDVLLDERNGRAEERFDAQRKLTIIAEALATLPPEWRKAFLLRKMEGLRVKEIARRLDLSVSAVEKRLARALTLVNVWLLDNGHDPAEFGATIAKAYDAQEGKGNQSDSAAERAGLGRGASASRRTGEAGDL